jgi:hypothetical protein
MKTIAILTIILSLSSCSLLHKRRSHFDYAQRGTLRSVVDENSGEPIKKNILKNGEVYIYRYCRTPYWKEAVLGVLTFGFYNIGCRNSMGEIELLFEDKKLVESREDTNEKDRARY